PLPPLSPYTTLFRSPLRGPPAANARPAPARPSRCSDSTRFEFSLGHGLNDDLVRHALRPRSASSPPLHTSARGPRGLSLAVAPRSEEQTSELQSPCN